MRKDEYFLSFLPFALRKSASFRMGLRFLSACAIYIPIFMVYNENNRSAEAVYAKGSFQYEKIAIYIFETQAFFGL